MSIRIGAAVVALAWALVQPAWAQTAPVAPQTTKVNACGVGQIPCREWCPKYRPKTVDRQSTCLISCNHKEKGPDTCVGDQPN